MQGQESEARACLVLFLNFILFYFGLVWFIVMTRGRKNYRIFLKTIFGNCKLFQCTELCFRNTTVYWQRLLRLKETRVAGSKPGEQKM